MLGCFNSLRELGGTRRLVEDEVRSRLSQYGRKRRRIGEDDPPFVDHEIREPRELTSRYSTSEVARTREALDAPYRSPDRLDVALATNMISVGLDIPRLGLMAVFAQPKMTSEYIQATSRVGRRADRPGLVATIFNINRSRDRSHYERFRFFHDTFYRNVEATSVTPFSPRALDRALFAVTVALARLGRDYMIRNEDAGAILKHGRHLDEVARTVAERARCLGIDGPSVGPIAETPIYRKVRGLLDDWSQYADRLARDQMSLRYVAGKLDGGRVRKLLHEMLDPALPGLARAERQFKAPRSMREVEPNVAILPRRLDEPTGWIKVRNDNNKSEITISSLRQSQLVTTYGPGAMIDLPWFAVVVSGLDFWARGTTIPEPRLEAKAQAAIGSAVALATPKAYEGSLSPETQEGVRAWRFPGWSITQETRRVVEPGGESYVTRRLVREAWLDRETGLYKRPDDNRPGHDRAHAVVPIRFIRACKNGHMGNIDWPDFVHGGARDCKMDLWLDDFGATGELTDLRVRCECGRSRRMSEAAGNDNHALGRCDGSRRWLGPIEQSKDDCREWNRLLIRTASNTYFPQKLSVISMPDRGREIHAAVEKHWHAYLQHVQDSAGLGFVRRIPAIAEDLAGFDDDEVMAAIEEKHAGAHGPPQRKIKVAEFELLTCGRPTIGEDAPDSEFYAEEFSITGWPERYRRCIDRVLVVHRLREVSALVGFTRFDYISPDIDGEYDLETQPGRLALNISWVPAFENKGEGLFLQFNKEAVDGWSQREAVGRLAAELKGGLANWCIERNVVERTFFGAPYVMLHSLSHMLINAISLECGYPASSIRERIYANPDHGYGILLYTAAADSYGTLGGLAHAARSLDHYLGRALESAQLCSNDPVCAEHRANDPNSRRYLLGSACHGCLLISETSCEMFNDFLDRRLVVPTVSCRGAEFFEEP